MYRARVQTRSVAGCEVAVYNGASNLANLINVAKLTATIS